jgi:hypothetical protein
VIALGKDDFIALEGKTSRDPDDPPVLYLSHGKEDVQLADSFTAFLTTWERLCYLGPEFRLSTAFVTKLVDYSIRIRARPISSARSSKCLTSNAIVDAAPTGVGAYRTASSDGRGNRSRRYDVTKLPNNLSPSADRPTASSACTTALITSSWQPLSRARRCRTETRSARPCSAAQEASLGQADRREASLPRVDLFDFRALM